MVKIVKVGEKDFPKFYGLIEKTLRDGSFLYPAKSASYVMGVWVPTPQQLKKNVAAGDKLYLAFENNNVIGYLLANREKAGVGFCHWLGIDKKFRHKGIGSKLLKRWEEDSIREGLHAIHLWTMENDLEFYKKNNFVLAGKFKNAWFGIDHFLLYKNIGKPNPKKYV